MKKLKSINTFIIVTIVILLVLSSFLTFKYTGSLRTESYNPDSEYETAHFNIYYPSKYYSEKQIKIFSEISERILERNIQILEIEKEFNEVPYFKISVYLYPSDRLYRESYNGLGLARYTNNIACMTVYPNEINENLTSKICVGHEYRHILINKFWSNAIYFPFTKSLIGYLGEREMYPESVCIYDYLVKEEIKSGDINEFIKNAFKNRNFSFLGRTNYEEFIKFQFYSFYSSSFVGYLIESYGIDKIKRLAEIGIKGDNLKKIYGKNEDELLNEWKDYILSLPKPSKEIEKRLEPYLSRPKVSVVKKYIEFNKEIRDSYFSNNNLETKKLLINYLFFSRINSFGFTTYSSWLSITNNSLSLDKKILSDITFYPFYFFYYCPYRLILLLSLIAIILLLLLRRRLNDRRKNLNKEI